MSVSATYQGGLTVVETITVGVADVNTGSNANITHDQFNKTQTLSAGTSPAASVTASWQAALSGGAATIDLTAMPGTNGATVSASGLAPRCIVLQNPATNANPITAVKGVTNGYTGLGAAFSVVLQPGQEARFNLAGNGTAVSGSVKTLDLSGTASQALNIQVLAG